MVHRHRRHSGAQRSAQISLVDGGVVPVPVQMHALARLLVPKRRKIGRADQFVVWKLVQRPVELNRFVRIECIHAAPAPGRQKIRSSA